MEGQRAPGYSGLVRMRLLDHLDTACAAGPAVVVAPAGFGKTTLLTQYARRHDGPVAAYQAHRTEAVTDDTAVRLIEAVFAATRHGAGPVDDRTPWHTGADADTSDWSTSSRRRGDCGVSMANCGRAMPSS